MQCLKCPRPVTVPKTGRPPLYCSPGCRRAAELEVKRLVVRLDGVEKQMFDIELSLDIDAKYTYRSDKKLQVERLEGLERARVRIEERLRLLLEDRGTTPEKSGGF